MDSVDREVHVRRGRYLCYKVRHARADAAAQAHARNVRRQPLGARTSDALLSSWRAAHLVGVKADKLDSLRHLAPDELATQEYDLPRRRSLVLEFRDSSGCSPEPTIERGEPLLDQMIAHARELLDGVEKYCDKSPSPECWRVNDPVRAGGGAEKLCVAALVLHGVCEVAVEEFVMASVSFDDKREFWCELTAQLQLDRHTSSNEAFGLTCAGPLSLIHLGFLRRTLSCTVPRARVPRLSSSRKSCAISLTNARSARDRCSCSWSLLPRQSNATTGLRTRTRVKHLQWPLSATRQNYGRILLPLF